MIRLAAIMLALSASGEPVCTGPECANCTPGANGSASASINGFFGGSIGVGTGWQIRPPQQQQRQQQRTRIERVNDLQAYASVVQVQSNTGEWWGSGVLVRWRGRMILLTAAHVVEQARDIVVRTITGVSVRCRVVHADRVSDFAVAVPEAESGLKATTLGRVQVRSDAYACGYGPQMPLATMHGTVMAIVGISGPRLPGPANNAIQIAGGVPRGWSGGPIFDAGGSVIGIISGCDDPDTLRANQSTVGCRIEVVIAALEGIVAAEQTAKPESKPLVPVLPGPGDDEPGKTIADPPEESSKLEQELAKIREEFRQLREEANNPPPLPQAEPPKHDQPNGEPDGVAADLLTKMAAMQAMLEARDQADKAKEEATVPLQPIADPIADGPPTPPAQPTAIAAPHEPAASPVASETPVISVAGGALATAAPWILAALGISAGGPLGYLASRLAIRGGTSLVGGFVAGRRRGRKRKQADATTGGPSITPNPYGPVTPSPVIHCDAEQYINSLRADLANLQVTATTGRDSKDLEACKQARTALELDLENARQQVAELQTQLAEQPVQYRQAPDEQGLRRMRMAMKSVSDAYPSARQWVQMMENAYTLTLSGETKHAG